LVWHNRHKPPPESYLEVRVDGHEPVFVTDSALIASMDRTLRSAVAAALRAQFGIIVPNAVIEGGPHDDRMPAQCADIARCPAAHP
jgi:hypothetical protein